MNIKIGISGFQKLSINEAIRSSSNKSMKKTKFIIKKVLI